MQCHQNWSNQEGTQCRGKALQSGGGARGRRTGVVAAPCQSLTAHSDPGRVSQGDQYVTVSKDTFSPRGREESQSSGTKIPTDSDCKLRQIESLEWGLLCDCERGHQPWTFTNEILERTTQKAALQRTTIHKSLRARAILAAWL